MVDSQECNSAIWMIQYSVPTPEECRSLHGTYLFQMGEPDSSGIKLSDETTNTSTWLELVNSDVPSGSEIENVHNLQYGASSSQLESLAFGWNLFERVSYKY